ncbi:hypothetical protein BRADI_3g36566v3 [Brachypodium distachyon]|uniref:Uncharacterized protein n=1 Tax=Brachypodium distachyon TaxID=15368 RepID=A0A2K2D1H7_BRADI|nr:hypothetical protein BRADI_3g36566v3 [Brachypodium distachyon]
MKARIIRQIILRDIIIFAIATDINRILPVTSPARITFHKTRCQHGSGRRRRGQGRRGRAAGAARARWRRAARGSGSRAQRGLRGGGAGRRTRRAARGRSGVAQAAARARTARGGRRAARRTGAGRSAGGGHGAGVRPGGAGGGGGARTAAGAEEDDRRGGRRRRRRPNAKASASRRSGRGEERLGEWRGKNLTGTAEKREEWRWQQQTPASNYFLTGAKLNVGFGGSEGEKRGLRGDAQGFGENGLSAEKSEVESWAVRGRAWPDFSDGG